MVSLLLPRLADHTRQRSPPTKASIAPAQQCLTFSQPACVMVLCDPVRAGRRRTHVRGHRGFQPRNPGHSSDDRGDRAVGAVNIGWTVNGDHHHETWSVQHHHQQKRQQRGGWSRVRQQLQDPRGDHHRRLQNPSPEAARGGGWRRGVRKWGKRVYGGRFEVVFMRCSTAKFTAASFWLLFLRYGVKHICADYFLTRRVSWLVFFCPLVVSVHRPRALFCCHLVFLPHPTVRCYSRSICYVRAGLLPVRGAQGAFKARTSCADKINIHPLFLGGQTFAVSFSLMVALAWSMEIISTKPTTLAHTLHTSAPSGLHQLPQGRTPGSQLRAATRGVSKALGGSNGASAGGSNSGGPGSRTPSRRAVSTSKAAASVAPTPPVVVD